MTAKPKPRPTITETVYRDDLGSGSEANDEEVYYSNCDDARAAGADPVLRGDPGYGGHLDGDDDGVACE